MVQVQGRRCRVVADSKAEDGAVAKDVKRLCKWKSGSYGDRLDDLRSIVDPPKFVCESCGRVAARKKYLCKPVRLASRNE
jgi:hypothetical protein